MLSPKKAQAPIAQPTGIPYELSDGSIVHLTLSYGLLAKLREIAPVAYEAYNKAQSLLQKEPDLQTAILIYVAYLCGLINQEGSVDGARSQEEFLAGMLGNRNYDGETFIKLFAPNPTTASATRS